MLRIVTITILFVSMLILVGCDYIFDINLDSSTYESQEESDNMSTDNIMFSKISELLYDNDCSLPCFADLIPGIDDNVTLGNFVSDLDVDEATLHKYGTGYSLTYNYSVDNSLDVSFQMNQEQTILSFIGIRLTNPYEWLVEMPYSLPTVFNQLGTPDDIFFIFGGRPLGYSLIVLYNESGVMLRYQIDYVESDLANSNIPLPLCFTPEIADLRVIDIWIQEQSSNKLVETYLSDLRDSSRDTRPSWTLEQVSDSSIEDFVNFFIENPNDCFTVYSFLQLKELGYQF